MESTIGIETGQPWQDSLSRKGMSGPREKTGQDSQSRITVAGQAGQPEQDSSDGGTAATGQPRQDNRGRTVVTGYQGGKSTERSVRIDRRGG
jgi:hypothetical protein